MRLLLLLLLAAPLAAAQPPPPTCVTPDHAQLDFWVGDWALSWPGGQGGTPENATGHGTNTITKTLDGCVVHERFESADGYHGESVSVYHAPTGEWRQTWVDNRGGYLLLTGGPADDGTMTLQTAPFTNPQGQEQISRMLWTDVTGDALTWRWQASTDGGATWADRWTIRYTRR